MHTLNALLVIQFLNSTLNIFNRPWQSFEWHEGDLEYALWDSAKGWSIKIIEKDWSSFEGDHYDTVLDKTYCRAVD